MGKQKVSIRLLIAAAIALLLLTTAAHAVMSTKPPCYNGVQDAGEAGVDCGGGCASPSMIELCDGNDNDHDCTVDEDCKNWPSGNSGLSEGLSASGKAGDSGGKAQGPPQGYQPFKVPQPSAGSSGSAVQASSAVVQPQKAPEPEPLKSIPQDTAASRSQAIPAEQVPAQVPAESSGQVGTAASEAEALSSGSVVQNANIPAQVNGKTGDVKAKSQQNSPPNKESQSSDQGKQSSFTRIARFFRKLFG